MAFSKHSLCTAAPLGCTQAMQTQIHITPIIICLFTTDSSLVSKEAAADSELLAAIGKCLNKNIRGVKNWRNLAHRLNIHSDVYNTFDISKEVEQGPSPTKMLFQWLEKAKLKLTVKDLLNGLREINRYDVVELVIEEVAVGKMKPFNLGPRDCF